MAQTGRLQTRTIIAREALAAMDVTRATAIRQEQRLTMFPAPGNGTALKTARAVNGTRPAIGAHDLMALRRQAVQPRCVQAMRVIDGDMLPPDAQCLAAMLREPARLTGLDPLGLALRTVGTVNDHRNRRRTEQEFQQSVVRRLRGGRAGPDKKRRARHEAGQTRA